MSATAQQADLFAPPPIVPGLAYAPDILDAVEETELIARIDAAPLQPFRFQRWLGKRLTASYGWSYDFETGGFAPTDPIPHWLAPIRTRAAAFAGVPADALVQVLLIRYDPGAGIGWHRDRPVFDHVVGVSLGAPATLRLRRREDGRFARAAVDLSPVRRGAACVGTQHRPDGRAALVDHLPLARRHRAATIAAPATATPAPSRPRWRIALV